MSELEQNWICGYHDRLILFVASFHRRVDRWIHYCFSLISSLGKRDDSTFTVMIFSASGLFRAESESATLN